MYFTVLLLKISTVWKWNKFWELELVPDLTAFRWNNVRLTVSRTCLQSEAMKIHFKHPQKSNKGYDWPSPYSTVNSMQHYHKPKPSAKLLWCAYMRTILTSVHGNQAHGAHQETSGIPLGMNCCHCGFMTAEWQSQLKGSRSWWGWTSTHQY